MTRLVLDFPTARRSRTARVRSGRGTVRRATASLFALALAVFVAACQDSSAQLAEHLELGAGYLEAEEWPEAILEYKNAIQLDPQDAAAQYGLAKAYLGAGDARKAFWALDDVVRLDPDNVEARLQHAQFLLFGSDQEIERVLESADHIIQVAPERWEAQVLRARALDNLDRDDEALEAYRVAADASVEGAEAAIVLYANFLREQGEAEAAEAQFRRFAEAEPGFAGTAALAGFLSSFPDREAEAEQGYRDALALATSSDKDETEKQAEIKAAYTVLVNFLIRNQRLDEAEQELLNARGQLPDDRQLLYNLAQFYASQGRVAEADETIERATEATPDDPEPFLLLSTYRGFNGDLAGALEAAEKAVEVAPDDVTARLRRAEVLLDMGFGMTRSGDAKGGELIAKGRAAVDAVLAKDETNPTALFVQGKISLAEGKTDEAERSLRRALEGRPQWAKAHYVLASTQYVQGDKQGARSSTVRALELDANLIEARRLLARLHGELGDHDLAVEAGRQVLGARGSDGATRVIVAQSLVRKGDLDGALAELEKIPLEERNAESHYAIGRTLQYLGRPADARPHFERAIAEDERNPEILRALLQLDVGEGRLAESVARVDAAVEATPDVASLHVLQGEVAMLEQRGRDAERSFERAKQLDPNSLAAYQRLASLYVMEGRSEEVVATYEQALEKNPESDRIHMDLALLYELRGKVDKAKERYESAIGINPDLAVAKNNLAYLIAEHGGNLDRALDLAQDAKRSLPSNPNTADTLGWVLFKKNVPEAAIVHLREAVENFEPDDPALPVVRLHLALAYEADGETDLARTQIESAQQESQRIHEGASQEAPWAAEIRQVHKRLTGS